MTDSEDAKKKRELIENRKLAIPPEMRQLMLDVDLNVRRLIDTVRFILKYKIIFRGRGLEFEGLREYSTTDDASMIDWKISRRVSSSKKVDKLYVRIYEEERDLNIFVLLDTSETMRFGTQEKLKCEYASVLAGTLIYTAIEVGDKAGIGMYSDGFNKVMLPSKTSDQYYRILRELANPVNYGGVKSDLALPLRAATAALDRKSIIFIISDFIGVGSEWEDVLKGASAKFEGVLGIMVRDVRDSFIPEGLGNFRLRDPLTGSVTEVDFDSIRSKFEKEALEQERHIEEIFKKNHSGFIKCYTNEPFINPLIKWFNLWGTGR